MGGLLGHKGLNNRNSNKKLTGSSIFECKTKVGVSFGLYLSHYKRSSNSTQVPTQTQADELTDINYSVAAGLQTAGKYYSQKRVGGGGRDINIMQKKRKKSISGH